MKLKHLFFFLVMLPAVAFADVPIVAPDVDPFAALMSLIMQWKTIGPLAGGAMGVSIVVGLITRFAPEDFKYKRVSVTALGVIYGILYACGVQGMGLVEAAVTALFVSGGAVAIYEAVKGIKKAFKLGA